MIEEMKLKDFPWDEMPWALHENGSPYIPGSVTEEASVLLLLENGTKIAYLVYDVWSYSGYVEIHYAQTYLPFQNKGCATKLVNEVYRKYGAQYDVHLYQTSGVSVNSLKRWNFEKPDPGQTLWVRRKAV